MHYTFIEHGISKLSAILRSDVVVSVSIGIMMAFVEMKKFWATNLLILSLVNDLEIKQTDYQKRTDEELDKVYIYNHAEA